MRTLSNYKRAYKTAKTSKGRTSAFNAAMLNLSESEKQEFMKWQVDLMKNES